MKRYTTNAKVLGTSYKNTSYYGNPSYYVSFVTDEGEILTGYTASNAACGYSCTNYNGKKCRISYHTTRKGTLIIDYINDLK